jgi:amino acid adenylation domain-containing protein
MDERGNSAASIPLPVSDVPATPEHADKTIPPTFNNTSAAFPQGRLIHQLFEERARLTPDAVALQFENHVMTYCELDTRADHLAQRLTSAGISADGLVALCVSRGPGMVIGMLGVLKAGGAYVPLDPSYPLERLRYMLDDSTPTVILTESAVRSILPSTETPVIELDVESSIPSRSTPFTRRHECTCKSADQLAFVIYTSGSTGRPKGVMVEHAAVVNMLIYLQGQLGIEPDDCMLGVTTISFDIASVEVFLPLVSGARVAIAPREVGYDTAKLMDMVDRFDVGFLQATPATWQLLLSAGWMGKPGLKAVSGGEALTAELSSQIASRVGSLWNLYGPTETTVYSCGRRIATPARRGTLESIGRPIANTHVHILDDEQREVPIGVTGEIYIAGAGVARGYLNRPELTAERFLADRFAADTRSRMYRTGDLGRWRTDGNIEYLGRNDHQVKIRGYRIELGEIESRLASLSHVSQAVVIASRDISSTPRLIAYVVLTKECRGKDRGPNLREALKSQIPEYMLPSLIVMLDSLPMTPNGKIDRRSLPVPKPEAHPNRAYDPPRGETEKMLAKIWQGVLGITHVGREDNFFELGGDSLLAMKMMTKLAKKSAVRVNSATVFQHSNIRKLAELLGARARADTAIPGPQRRRTSDPIPLTFFQKMAWRLLPPGKRTRRAIHIAVRLSGTLNVGALSQSIEELVRRHEALRTRIVVTDDSPMQVVDESHRFELDIVNLPCAAKRANELEAGNIIRRTVGELVDVSTGPLFTAQLLRLASDDHVLAIAMAHIISDDASASMVLRDTLTLYAQSARSETFSLPFVGLQFADYAMWQQNSIASWLENHAGFWKKRLAGARRVKVFANAENTGCLQPARSSVPIRFGKSLRSRLLDFCRPEQTTVSTCILAAYAAVMLRWSRQYDLVITTITMGRPYPEVERSVGFFATPLLIRADLQCDDTFRDFLARVADRVGEAYENDDSGRIAAQIPWPQFAWNFMFNWTPIDFHVSPDAHAPSIESEGVTRLDEPMKMSSFPVEIEPFGEVGEDDRDRGPELSLVLADTEDGISGMVAYRADLVGIETMERFVDNLELFVENLISNPDQRIAGLKLR